MNQTPQPATGIIEKDTHRYPLRVFYDDTDAGGVVYHANYLRWLERARSDLLDLLGIDQRAALEAGQGHYAVAEVAIRYLAPSRLGDAVVVKTTARRIGRVRCVLEQSVWCDGVRLAEATVKVGFIGADRRPRRQPEAWQQAFTAFASRSESGADQEGPE